MVTRANIARAYASVEESCLRTLSADLLIVLNRDGKDEVERMAVQKAPNLLLYIKTF